MKNILINDKVEIGFFMNIRHISGEIGTVINVEKEMNGNIYYVRMENGDIYDFTDNYIRSVL